MTAIYGFGRYIRFIARRERLIGLLWILCISVFSVAIAAAYPNIIPTTQEMYAMAQTMNTPATIAMMGPVYGMDALTTAIVMSQECLLWIALAAAVMNIFFIVRHTREDEELGRLEMLRSLPVGRLANPTAALVSAFAMNLIVSGLIALGLSAVNIPGTNLAGALVYGLSVGAVGFMFAGLTLLSVQLFTTPRGATALMLALLFVFYVMRASGDISGNALSYISPLGLCLKVYAFYDNNPLPILLLLTEGLVFGAIGLAICQSRDLGEGVIPARPGKKHASRFLLSPFGLAWRLKRNSLIAWSIAGFALGASYGSVIGEMERFVESNEMVKKLLEAIGAEHSMIDSFVAMIFMIMAILGTCSAITAVTKIRSEENRGRLEQIYSKSVSRTTMFASYIIIAIIQSLLVMLLSALGMYAASYSSGLLNLDLLIKAALCYVPALLAVAGATVLLVGLLPKLTALIWVLMTYSFVACYFGKLLEFPDWAAKLTPFGHIPQLPVQDFNAAPLIILTLTGSVLAIAGISAYRRRDIK